jgi:hypothetical protein
MWLTPICKLIIGQIIPRVTRLFGIAFAFAGRRCNPLKGSFPFLRLENKIGLGQRGAVIAFLEQFVIV